MIKEVFILYGIGISFLLFILLFKDPDLLDSVIGLIQAISNYINHKSVI